VLIAPRIEIPQVQGQPRQEAQLLDPQVHRAQQPHTVARVGGLDQPLAHVEGGGLDAVTQQEALAAGKLPCLSGWATTQGLLEISAGTGGTAIAPPHESRQQTAGRRPGGRSGQRLKAELWPNRISRKFSSRTILCSTD